MLTVFVHWVALTKIALSVLNNNLFLTVLEARGSRIKALVDLVPGEDWLPGSYCDLTL